MTLIFCFFIVLNASAQKNRFQARLVSVSFPDTISTFNTHKKHFISTRSVYNPLAYVGASLLYIYQNLLSEQIQATCMYKISCSEHTRLSIQKFGILEGTLRGFNQLTECFNGAQYEHARVFVDTDKKIMNSINGEK